MGSPASQQRPGGHGEYWPPKTQMRRRLKRLLTLTFDGSTGFQRTPQPLLSIIFSIQWVIEPL